MNKNTSEYYVDRDKDIYELYISGHKYKTIALYHDLTVSGVKQALRRHRERNNLPKGRTKDPEARAFYVGRYREDCEK